MTHTRTPNMAKVTTGAFTSHDSKFVIGGLGEHLRKYNVYYELFYTINGISFEMKWNMISSDR